MSKYNAEYMREYAQRSEVKKRISLYQEQYRKEHPRKEYDKVRYSVPEIKLKKQQQSRTRGQTIMSDLRAIFNNKCANCSTTERLQFAHTKQTPMSDVNRRSQSMRKKDILTYLDSYALLCEPCHKKMGGPEGWKDKSILKAIGGYHGRVDKDNGSQEGQEARREGRTDASRASISKEECEEWQAPGKRD